MTKTPDIIEHLLTQEILRGTYAPGSRLPTIRALATSNGVNPATIQRVIARLETRGLVRVRQGSGISVNDPLESGDISLVPLWLEAALDVPERAAAILADLLEMRRVMGARLLVRHREAIIADQSTLLDLAANMAAASDQGLDALQRADLAFTRRLLLASGNVLAVMLLNTVAQVLDDLPFVAQAMYADPSNNAASMLRSVDILLRDGDDAERLIEAEMATIDALTVQRFLRLLAERTESSDLAGSITA